MIINYLFLLSLALNPLQLKDYYPIPFFSQHDDQWGDNALGRRYTISEAGCLVSTLAMLFNYELCDNRITPATLDDWLWNNEGFKGDTIQWQAVIVFARENGLPWRRVTLDFYPDLSDYSENEFPLIGRVNYWRHHRKHRHFLLLKTKSGLLNDPGDLDGENLNLNDLEYTLDRITILN